MANDDNAADAGSPRPRAAPTIDLKAREVSSSPVEAAKAGTDSKPAADRPSAPDPSSSARPPNGPRGGMSFRMAGILGALSALAFFAIGAWLGGAYRHEWPIAASPPAPTTPVVEAAQQPAPPAPQTEPAPARDVAADLVKPLEEGIAGLHRRLDELAAATQDTRARAEQAAAAAENASKSGSEAIRRGDVDALVGRLTALEKAITEKPAEPVQKAADTAAIDAKIKIAIAAVELRGAVERGVPYASEYAAAKGMAGDAGSLSTLEPYAASGIPSNEALARELAALAPAMLHADAPEGAGLLERLQARAARLVHIRPRGEIEGDEPPQIVARAEAKTLRGDLSGAVVEIEKLPPSMRAPAQGWLDNVRRREAAIAASRKLAVDALKAIGKPDL